MDTRELDILPLRVSGYLARDPGVFKNDPNPAKNCKPRMARNLKVNTDFVYFDVKLVTCLCL